MRNNTNKKEPKILAYMLPQYRGKSNSSIMKLMFARLCGKKVKSYGWGNITVEVGKLGDSFKKLGATYDRCSEMMMQVKDFSELTKQERRRHIRQVNLANAKIALFHKEYFRYIYLMLKSIF